MFPEEMSIDGTDLGFALLCFICFVVGVPANLVALHYFLSKTRDIPTCIYIVISAVDVLTCILILPVGGSYSVIGCVVYWFTTCLQILVPGQSYIGYISYI